MKTFAPLLVKCRMRKAVKKQLGSPPRHKDVKWLEKLICETLQDSVDSYDVRTGVVLMALALNEYDPEEVWRITKYEKKFVADVAWDYARHNVNWNGSIMFSDWLREDGGDIGFILDNLVAQGRLVVFRNNADDEPTYQHVEWTNRHIVDVKSALETLTAEALETPETLFVEQEEFSVVNWRSVLHWSLGIAKARRDWHEWAFRI